MKGKTTRSGITLPTDSQKLMKMIFNSKRLTTPTQIDENVKAFCKTINPDVEPIYLPTRPEDWSRQGCCDQNVKRYIQDHGGKLVCGYRLWYYKNLYIEGERHAVWQSPHCEYRDVSFSVDGECSIVFIPDVSDKQSALNLNRDKIPHAIDPRLKQIAEQINNMYNSAYIEKVDDETAWNSMLSYEEWKRGVRRPSLTVIPRVDAGNF
ncbi:MAG: hypothetical protein O7G85_16760 [Planctomycetota bacterium]|nr:hypothetical protein [Planctomycetota bacterium]